MSGSEGDFLSAFRAACSSLVGRAILFMLAWVLGIVAAHATAQHEFVWPWVALREVFFLALMSFFRDGLTAVVVYVAVLALQVAFMSQDEHWGVLAIPFVLVWVVSHRALTAFGQP